MIRLVQLKRGAIRRVGVVEEPRVRLLGEYASIFGLAQAAIADETTLAVTIRNHATDELVDYDPIYDGRSEWQLLLPIDHPDEPARCLVSGTGLTHLGSAKNRQAMHEMKEGKLKSGTSGKKVTNRKQAVAIGLSIAYFIDSPGTNVFVGATPYSYLSGTNGGQAFFDEAQGFALINAAFSEGGRDFAYNFDPSHNLLSGPFMLLA